jgi:hypothetical protein
MPNFSIKGLIPGKKYRMVVQAKTVDGDIDMPRSIEFTVPKASAHAREFAMDSTIVKKTTKTEVKAQCTLKIPPKVLNNLIWEEDVRDIVIPVFRYSTTKNMSSIPLKSFINSIEVNSVPSAPAYISSSKHPAVFKRTFLKSKGFFSFRFLVVRYIRVSTVPNDVWEGQWLHSGSDISQRLSKETIISV